VTSSADDAAGFNVISARQLDHLLRGELLRELQSRLLRILVAV
jgi:hypothetical protein